MYICVYIYIMYICVYMYVYLTPLFFVRVTDPGLPHNLSRYVTDDIDNQTEAQPRRRIKLNILIEVGYLFTVLGHPSFFVISNIPNIQYICSVIKF